MRVTPVVAIDGAAHGWTAHGMPCCTAMRPGRNAPTVDERPATGVGCGGTGVGACVECVADANRLHSHPVAAPATGVVVESKTTVRLPFRRGETTMGELEEFVAAARDVVAAGAGRAATIVEYDMETSTLSLTLVENYGSGVGWAWASEGAKP